MIDNFHVTSFTGGYLIGIGSAILVYALLRFMLGPPPRGPR